MVEEYISAKERIRLAEIERDKKAKGNENKEESLSKKRKENKKE